MKKEQFSVQTFIFKKISIENMMKGIAAAGIPNIQFYAAAPHFCHYADFPASEEEIAAKLALIKGTAAENGITIDCFAPESMDYPINIASEDEIVRKKSIDYFIGYLKDAAALGCKRLLLTSGWSYFNKSREEAWERSKDSLQQICAAAAPLGITVLLRPASKFHTQLVNNLYSLAQMIEEVGSPALVACIDASNLGESGDTISDYFRTLPGKVGYFRYYSFDENGCIAEGGPIDKAKEYFDELDANGYDGIISCEMNFEYLVDPVGYTKKFAEAVAPLFE